MQWETKKENLKNDCEETLYHTRQQMVAYSTENALAKRVQLQYTLVAQIAILLHFQFLYFRLITFAW